MSKIVEILNSNGFKGIGKCSEKQIEKAEKEIGIKFPQEYRDFLTNFQAGSFMGHELMGIDTMEYLNTVANTIFERENDGRFPNDCLVLEDVGIEGLLVLLDKNGQIFSYCDGKKKMEAASFLEYVEMCLNEK